MYEPHIHHNTQNFSAIKIYNMLNALGVKNCKFMLTVYDADLMYIDPFDKNLPKEMQQRVHAEIVRNYWYFLREIVRIDVPGGTVRFEFNRGNLALSWLLMNNINTYTEIPRQTTKTGTVASRIAYIWAFASQNSKAAFLANTPNTVKGNLERVKSVLTNLPWYLQIFDPKKDTNNKESLRSSTSNNLITVLTPPGNPDQANNKSRGSTEETQWFDEVPHINFAKIIILNSAPAWGKAKDFAEANKTPYGRIFTSTPGILGTDDGDFVFYDFLPQCLQFDERLFYDQPNLKALKQLVYEQSKNDFVYIRFTYRQLGFGESYFEAQCRMLQNNLEAISREVLLMWARRLNDSPFTKEQLDRVFKHVGPPIGTITIRDTYVLKLYKKPDTSKKYMISIDCSGMLDNDYSSIVITDPQTFEIVGTLRSNARTLYSNTTIFTYSVIDIMKMFPQAVLAIEKNNMGIAIIDNIMTLAPDIINRLYASSMEPNTKTDNESYYMSTAENINLSSKTVAYGFDTNNIRRGQMFSEILGIIINELYDVIHDNDIYIELNNIIRNKKGRLDHKQGKHDDLLFAWLIGLWVLCYSKVLTERFEYPVGYIRPISLSDDGIKRIEESSLLSKESHVIDEAVKVHTASAGIPSFEPTSYMFEKPNVDADNYRPRSSVIEDNIVNNPSFSEIAAICFEHSESLLDTSDKDGSFDLEFDKVIAEDKYEQMSTMNAADRTDFKKRQFEELDQRVLRAKMTKAQSLEKARNVRKENVLREKLRETSKDTISESALDTIIDTWLG